MVTAVQAASFDCAKAGTKVERLICGDKQLSALDDELGSAYREALRVRWSEKLLPDSQKAWLKERNGCSTAQCVRDAYQRRIRELDESYKVVMSKDEKVCNAMLAVYNEDMKAGGSIRYDEHEMFNIGWQTDARVPDVMDAVFDINNDGKQELVLRTTQGFHGIHTDTFYIFPESSDILTRIKRGPGGLKPMLETPNWLFSSEHPTYELKDLPSPLVGSLDVYYVLEPFVFNGTTYISMTDAGPSWIVIAKYLERERMQDICYFHDENIPPFVFSPAVP